jgi:hypothetical protein
MSACNFLPSSCRARGYTCERPSVLNPGVGPGIHERAARAARVLVGAHGRSPWAEGPRARPGQDAKGMKRFDLNRNLFSYGGDARLGGGSSIPGGG